MIVPQREAVDRDGARRRWCCATSDGRLPRWRAELDRAPRGRSIGVLDYDADGRLDLFSSRTA